MKLSDKLTFGKYKGQILKDVLNLDPEYLEWCLKNVKFFEVSKRIKSEIEKHSQNSWVSRNEDLIECSMPYY